MTGLVLSLSAQAIMSFYMSISGGMKARMFPLKCGRWAGLGDRVSGAAAQALFGGFAEHAPPGPKSVGHGQAFYGDVAVMMAIAFLTTFRQPREAGYRHHNR